MEEKRIVKPWQAGLMLLVGIAVIIVGLLVMKLNNRIVLALDGVIMCLMAWCFGIPYAELQQGIKETVSSMIVAILILLAVGVLVGTWMASGTVPVMIYYGMKVLTPGLFLPVVCILCTLMSTMAGTSWGTLATVGVACMGVAQGLGVPLPAAAGAVCTGAFFGDKVSPLSDSPVITATVCEVPLMDGIRHALISTGPAYLISLVFYFVYGLRYSGGSVGGEVYEDILSTVSAEFWLSPVLLLPVLVVVVLILMKKPTIPTFIAGIAAGAVMAMLCQGVSLHDILTVMYSGFSADTGSDVVNSMLNRGGFTSMLSTIGLLIAAGIFGAPLRTAGVVDVLLAFVERIAKTSRSMSLGVLILHAVFFTITGAYYVSYPVVGGMVKDLYPEYHLDRKNLMRTMLDTGTGLAPMVSWSTTGSYTATTLGVSNLAFAPFAPMLWLSIVFSVIYAVTGNLTPKAKKTIEKILGHSIVYYATWMDEWRAEPGYEHTSAWHTASVDKNLVYAPRPKGDVIFALEDAIAKLQDYKQQDDSTVVMSLRCIIHFVGDMHCPVHVKYADQKSYNVYLNGDKCSYHNVWDDQIISRSHRWGYLEYAHQLDRCTKQQIKTITAGTLRDWFHENARDSRHIYELVGPNEKLDKNETKSFVNHTHEYAERQILRAGYRLAHVLNELFD